MNNIIIRADDFDPRIKLEDIKPLHKEFVKRGIPMTIAVNSMMGHSYKFDKKVLDYVNSTDPHTWDIQLHGLEHDRLWAMTETQFFTSIYANLMLTKRDFIYSNPTILYPPWNEKTDIMDKVCKDLGITIKTTQKTIREFIKNWAIDNETIFFWHWWTPDDCRIIPEVLDKVLKIKNKT